MPSPLGRTGLFLPAGAPLCADRASLRERHLGPPNTLPVTSRQLLLLLSAQTPPGQTHHSFSMRPSHDATATTLAALPSPTGTSSHLRGHPSYPPADPLPTPPHTPWSDPTGGQGPGEYQRKGTCAVKAHLAIPSPAGTPLSHGHTLREKLEQSGKEDSESPRIKVRRRKRTQGAKESQTENGKGSRRAK